MNGKSGRWFHLTCANLFLKSVNFRYTDASDANWKLVYLLLIFGPERDKFSSGKTFYNHLFFLGNSFKNIWYVF